MTGPNDPIRQRLDRLDAIARVLRGSGDGLALLALGSAADTSRLDRYSDLDFFAIVRPGAKARFVADLWWLRDAAPADSPLAWAFQNTADGWKALYEDGVFLEMAVFEPQELAHIPFSPGRIVWQADEFDAGLCIPRQSGSLDAVDEGLLIGEILSNLLVGLGRYRRGERLAGLRSIQVYALDNLLRLARQRAGDAATATADRFNPDRRVEARLPDLAPLLPIMAGGVSGVPQSALAILDWVEAQGIQVAPALAREIRDLAR